MKRIVLFLLQFSFLMAMAQAQQVWTEGTQWEVEYNDGTPRTVFELISPVEIDGIRYFPAVGTMRHIGLHPQRKRRHVGLLQGL